ncbi:MAG: CBS domain-containing protein [Alphaproteobacteria bacterium]|nr:CBS domain-containing protein [Alphaproteobacteria bacterium]
MVHRQIADMVRHQNPLMLPASTTVKTACAALRDRRVGAVLVTDESGKLVGIFTGRDAVCRVGAEGRSASRTTLAEVMTANPDALGSNCTAVEALRRMRDGGYRHLPIVEGGKVVGIVSRGDFRGLEQARLDEETGLWERI